MKNIKTLILSLCAALLLSGCGTSNTVPITGRKQHLLVSDSEVLSLSNTQYKQYMQTAKLSTNASNTAMVKRVGQKLASAVEAYLKQNGMASEVNNYAWEFNLVQNSEMNAFCMPGGKIVVYEGLLPVTQDEASLAIVLGHEIAHAVAKHSAEKLSKQMKAQYGAKALSVVLAGAGVNSGLATLGQTAFSFGSNSVLRGFSRSNETEADYMGMIFAAMAGYDPAAAITFWQRMAASGSSSKAEFFSDHPSDEKRIANLKARLPEAQKYYKK